ncbi:major facilitator superfamily domain-containing protein 6-A-like isoform X2 [Portunus trituberculatus]|uniref:major facilitator superfamily domain-containing protein 6-A-like isoform X2 n=1 Tax=Portunus trituberculatus TaxID=210409 RepID=UPI001E1CEBE6|nr:major facilitator superfamily domain-containing protein 6-A-like isoform X2 [Portunus trituberculatus]
MGAPGWWQRTWDDLRKKEFIVLKLLFFILYGASSCMLPFLPTHARVLGITETELGVMYAASAFITLAGPPLTGMLADRLGNFKVFLSVTMAVSGGVALLYCVVPVGRHIHALPDNVSLSLTKHTDAHLTAALPPPLYCNFLPHLDTIHITLVNCTVCDVTPVGAGGCVPGGQKCAEQQVVTPSHGQTPLQVNIITATSNASFLHAQDAAVSLQGEVSGCGVWCLVFAAREDLCANSQVVEAVAPLTTFWYYLVVQVLNGLALAASFTLFDGATMVILRRSGGDYGLQRLYGNLGIVVLTPLSGTLIQWYSGSQLIQDYRPSFILYCSLKLVCGVIILFLDMEFRKPSERVTRDFKTLLRNPEVVTFLLIMFVSGLIMSVVETFIFWLLEDIGASSFLMSITVAVGSLAGIPVLIASNFFFTRLGYVNTIVLGFAFFVVRLVGYSFITNPWWSIPFEALECFTVSLKTAAAVSYATELATSSTLATLQGLHGGLYHGVGRGLGSLVGGYMIGPLGIVNTFRIMGAVSGVVGVAYFTLNKVFFKKLQQERKLQAENEKNAAQGSKYGGTGEQGGVITTHYRKRDSNENLPPHAMTDNIGATHVNSTFEREF